MNKNKPNTGLTDLVELDISSNRNIKYELNIKIDKNKKIFFRSDKLSRARPLEQSPHCSSNAHIFRWTNKLIEKNELKSKLANIRNKNKSAFADIFMNQHTLSFKE